ncbi:insulinase family protein [Clostridium hydrogenum]|uniref:insulinase family protein n=1 Tax=Clostridium hydrogenum TaxID=2855764 RepID=UPI001F3F46C8|nr:insulinase family protein [Clostridium hydrogenum]
MNSFKQNDVYHGFKFVSEEDVKEINSKAFMFEHVKSGAKLLYLENDDDNKVFSISFRTPPKDSTGVFHILEHSVLCGSNKYPVKEPFVELLKGSLNTFLNAFTFSDKTMYPVASKNDKDFLNLIDVYMDAVLHPNIYKTKQILEQEGWHYELNSAEEDITYKGVVYNEMKGAFSSPEGILMRKIQNSLFPDTSYGFESGGDPKNIPDLTYEDFIASHKKYYSPANSYIYLYGTMNLEEKLEFLDREYLSAYDRIDVDSSIAIQNPIGKDAEVVEEYPILPNESEMDKTYLSLNFAVSKSTNPETYFAFDVLEYLLLESPAAPLKKALIDAEIGKDVFGMYDNSIIQPYLSIVVKNSNEDKKDDLEKIVTDTLNKLVKDGIDKKLIEAAINVKEFQMREADYGNMPKGLVYSVKAMDSWLYDESPLINLKFEDTLAKVKKGLTENYFEKLIEEYILNSNHKSFVVVKPSKTIAEETAKKLAEKLKGVKEALSSDEINKLVSETESLKKRQSSQDSPEDLRKLPMLSLEDIDKKAEALPSTEKDINGVKTLFHEIFTNKIVYFNLYFDCLGIPEDKLQYISLLQEFLGRVDTEKYKYEELANEINIKTGDISFVSNVYTNKNNNDEYYHKFTVKSKVLPDKVGDAFELIEQIMHSSKFDNKKRIKEIIQEVKSRNEMAINEGGQSVAAKRLTSYFSASGKCNEKLNGLEYYKFICELDKDVDNKSTEIASNLKEVCELVFNKDNLVIGLTGEKDVFDSFENNIDKLKLKSKNTNNKGKLPAFENSSNNEALITSSKVQYVIKGFNFKKLGYDYSGKLQVLRNILSLDYLWNNVRVMGGAYGCGISMAQNGNLIFWSYRDPNLKETIKVYDEVPKFIENFNADDYEMTKYIIGTVSSLDSPLTPRKKGERSDENYFKGITDSDIQKERDEVLSTKKDDIKAFSKLLKDVNDKNCICVLGNDMKLKANKDIFNNLVDVFE